MREERKVRSLIKIEGAELIFKNFQGKASMYNAEGNRNFGVILDDDLAEEVRKDGWNVKYLRPDEDGYKKPWLPVKVKYGKVNPIVILINSRGKMKLTEETIDQLDWTRIKNCDLIIRPYNYPAANGRPAGVSAYLQSIYVTIDEDEFEMKYADIPNLGA